MMRRMDVHEAANRRLKIIFDYFDYVYVSFSGGKDSGILLHLCMDYIRMHAPLKTGCVPHGLRGAVPPEHGVRGKDVFQQPGYP